MIAQRRTQYVSVLRYFLIVFLCFLGGNAIDSTSVSDANMPTVVLTSTVNSSLASNATVWRTASWFAAQFSTVQSSYMDFSIQGQQFRYTGLTVTPGE